MSCPGNNVLQDFLEEQLPEIQVEAVVVHLNSCASCRAEMEQLKTVFKASSAYAAIQLNRPLNTSLINETMLKIKKASSSNFGQQTNTASKNPYNGLTWLKWLLIPALATTMLMIAVFSGPKTTEQNQVENPLFSLLNNRVRIVMGESDSEILVGDKLVKLQQLKFIRPNEMINLPKQAMLLVEVGNNTFTVEDQARFSITKNEITLEAGKATFRLHGPHDGFTVKTPFAQVTPLGTDFSVESKPLFCKVTLREGKLKLVSKSGIKRLIKIAGSIYIKADGRFAEKITDSHTDSKPSVQKDNETAGPNHFNGNGSDSPGKLIDSF
ncbi:MAG: hypothetical protein Kow0029_31330 [Candidatus Rifleibacteriota bacterium]